MTYFFNAGSGGVKIHFQQIANVMLNKANKERIRNSDYHHYCTECRKFKSVILDEKL